MCDRYLGKDGGIVQSKTVLAQVRQTPDFKSFDFQVKSSTPKLIVDTAWVIGNSLQGKQAGIKSW